MASLRQASQPKLAKASSISNVIAAGPKRAAPVVRQRIDVNTGRAA
jgi:hypothetical protein